MAAPPARAANWFALDIEGGQSSLEVDVSSLRWHGDRRELKVRISYPQGQSAGANPRGGVYRSVLATLEVNCESGQSFWRSVSFHPDARAEDAALREEVYGTGLPASQVQALISEKTWSTLRRSACVQPRSIL